jgi:hypothetical protein
MKNATRDFDQNGFFVTTSTPIRMNTSSTATLTKLVIVNTTPDLILKFILESTWTSNLSNVIFA